MTPSKAPLPFLGAWKLTTTESSRPDLPHPASGLTTFTQEEDDHAVPEDLMQASAVIASIIFEAANRKEMLPRRELPKP
jgi:hypothetical protein